MAVIAVAGFFIFRGNDNNQGQTPADGQSGTPSASQPTEKTSGSGEHAQGGATDNRGSDVKPTTDSVSSASGQITLYTPQAGSTLSSGGTISGSAKISAVQYRLVDDSVGVLAQGELKVVNGKYSGTVQFKPRASTGQLDIFSYNQSGAEVNSISISLKLKS